ncbi:MAG: flagellar protein FlaG [Steroidobacteraceae bacterium]
MSIDKIVGPSVGPTSAGHPVHRTGNAAQTAALPAAPSLEAVAQRIESYLKSVGRSLEFRVDPASGRTVISVRDSQTGDLIRQIPSEEAVRLADRIEEQTIVLVSERA